jgi:microcystin-dependent protein
MFCNGGTLSISENEGLFQLLGNTFGGNVNEATFGVPDFRAAAPRECHYCISLEGTFREEAQQRIVGQTVLSVTPDPPQYLLECAGQSLQPNRYFLLQQYMGARFGAPGKLPDLRDKAPAKSRYMMAAEGDDPNFPRNVERFLGELMLLPFDLADSQGFRLCNGDLLPAQQNRALANLLGTRFGGSEEQFALPDLRAAAPPKFNYYISLQGMLPPGN